MSLIYSNIDKANWNPTDYTTELHSMHVSPLKAMETIYWTQSLGYENITYQAHSQGYEKLLLLVTQTSG